MASLVADYGSDDDNTEDDDINNENDNFSSKSEVIFQGEENTSHMAKNFLITQEDSDSKDSSDSHNGEDANESESGGSLLPNSLEEKLPAPAIGGGKDAEGVTSVFSNPFEKAEIAKNSVLEQHVRMTEKLPERGNKKVCWKFKKGKCHMGKNCRYFHDQESVVGMVNEAIEEDGTSQESQGHNLNQMYFSSGNMVQGQAVVQEPVDDDNYMAGKKRKNRVGVSNNLLPPKKAMSTLSRQRQSERPWTVYKS